MPGFPGTRRRRFIWVLLSILLLIFAAQFVLLYIEDIELIGDLRPDDPSYRIIEVLDFSRLFIGIFVSLCVYFSHLLRAFTMWRGYCPFSSSEITRSPSHWTAAASRGIFAECISSIKYGHNLLVVLISLTLIVDTCFKLSSHILNLGQVMSEQEKDYVLDTCGDRICLCRLGWELSYFMPWSTAVLSATMVLSVLFTPVRCWSPVFWDAVRMTGPLRLRRFLRDMIPLSLISLVWTSGTAFSKLFWIRSYRANKAFLEAYVFMSLLNFLFEVFVLLWCSGWFVCSAFPVGQFRLAGSARFQDLGPSTGNHTGWSCLRHSLVPYSHAGKWHWRDMFASVCLLLLVNTELSTGIQVGGIIGTWALRIAVLAVALFFPDKTASYDDLEMESAGFGLVVDASQLRAAFLMAIRGERFTQPLRTYKASMLRMKQTLAVSYRWQPEGMQIAPGHSLNMSPWQMQEVAHVIREHRVAYVWIDTISVPQSGYPLIKATLLSRMMAVYASAGKTLALRSKEMEGSRYHQRGWTLQEFCSAGSLIIKDEPSSDIEVSGLHCVSRDEDSQMRQLREWITKRLSYCRPFWVYGGITADWSHSLDDLKASYRKYQDISGSVITTDPQDMLRALYPLMMNTPVEDQMELINLVEQVTELLGVQEPKLQGLYETEQCWT